MNQYSLILNKIYFSGLRIDSYFQLHIILEGYTSKLLSGGGDLAISFVVGLWARDSKSFPERRKWFPILLLWLSEASRINKHKCKEAGLHQLKTPHRQTDMQAGQRKHRAKEQARPLWGNIEEKGIHAWRQSANPKEYKTSCNYASAPKDTTETIFWKCVHLEGGFIFIIIVTLWCQLCTAMVKWATEQDQ